MSKKTRTQKRYRRVQGSARECKGVQKKAQKKNTKVRSGEKHNTEGTARRRRPKSNQRKTAQPEGGREATKGKTAQPEDSQKATRGQLESSRRATGEQPESDRRHRRHGYEVARDQTKNSQRTAREQPENTKLQRSDSVEASSRERTSGRCTEARPGNKRDTEQQFQVQRRLSTSLTPYIPYSNVRFRYQIGQEILKTIKYLI